MGNTCITVYKYEFDIIRLRTKSLNESLKKISEEEKKIYKELNSLPNSLSCKFGSEWLGKNTTITLHDIITFKNSLEELKSIVSNVLDKHLRDESINGNVLKYRLTLIEYTVRMLIMNSNKLIKKNKYYGKEININYNRFNELQKICDNINTMINDLIEKKQIPDVVDRVKTDLKLLENFIYENYLPECESNENVTRIPEDYLNLIINECKRIYPYYTEMIRNDMKLDNDIISMLREMNELIKYIMSFEQYIFFSHYNSSLKLC